MEESQVDGSRRGPSLHGNGPILLRIFAIWLSCAVVTMVTPASACHAQDNEGGAEAFSTFRIDRDDPIVVQGRVKGEDLSFILDSGTSRSALNADLRPLLEATGAEIDSRTPSEALKVPLFKSLEFELATTPPIQFQSLDPIACLDLREAKAAMGVPQIGILGVDFLKTRVVLLNFDAGIGTIRSKSVLKEGHLEHIHLAGGRAPPAVLMRLPSEGFSRFMIDTGMAGTSLQLEASLFEKLWKKKRILGNSGSKSVIAGGIRRMRTGFIDCVEFGPHRFFNLSVAEASESAIGLRFLRRFEVELDLPSKEARFRAGLRIDEEDSHTRAGMSVRRIDGNLFASDVLPESDAAKSGILDGDQIEAINGIAANDLSYPRIIYYFSKPGSEVKINLRRNGDAHEFVFRPIDDPQPFAVKSFHELIETSVDFDN